MTSRILTFVSCTIYFIVLCTLSIIGLTAIVIGIIGLGLYIPTLNHHKEYYENTCAVRAHQYDVCSQRNDLTCYSVEWSVNYIISNQVPERYLFFTIKTSSAHPMDSLTLF